MAIAEVDGTVTASEDYDQQNNSTWSLERISQSARATASAPYTYRYPESAGEGVDVYVIDTGIQPELEEFEGRACIGFSAFGEVESNKCGDAVDAPPGNPGASFAQNVLSALRGGGATAPPGVDKHGHGTHVAGTCGGVNYGVAKAATLVGVQVLNRAGTGSNSDVLAGLEYAVDAHKAKHGTRTGSVINMSLGGGRSATTNGAVAEAVKAGLVVVVAAGHDDENAENSSPASEPSVLTVGAATIRDEKADFSNFGDVVDVFAPGVGVRSVWYASNRE